MYNYKSLFNDIYNNIFLNLLNDEIDIFLCGGVAPEIVMHTKKVLRDYVRDELEKISKYNVWYPEKLFDYNICEEKSDMLTLEEYLGEHCDMLMLICNSMGTAAELGAFSSNDKTLEKLFVLNGEEYERKDSFIENGPIKKLKREKGSDRIIRYNNEKTDIMEKIRKVINKKYYYYQKPRKEKKFSSLDDFSSVCVFLIIIIFLFDSVTEKLLYGELSEFIDSHHNKIDIEIVTHAAINRLFDAELIKKEEQNYYLEKKGEDKVRELLKSNKKIVNVQDINYIRMKILKMPQYYQ